MLLGLVFLCAAGLPIFVANLQRTGPLEALGPGAFTSPRETPFPQAIRVSLASASSQAPFPIARPNHALASDETLADVWIQPAQPANRDSGVQVALWYESGVEIHLTPVSPNDPDPLYSDFPPELDVTYEELAGTRIRVVPVGVQDAAQPGSVAMVKEGVMITVFGWMPDLTEDDLRQIASTVSQFRSQQTP